MGDNFVAQILQQFEEICNNVLYMSDEEKDKGRERKREKEGETDRVR